MLFGSLYTPYANSGVTYYMVILRLLSVNWLQASEDLTTYKVGPVQHMFKFENLTPDYIYIFSLQGNDLEGRKFNQGKILK